MVVETRNELALYPYQIEDTEWLKTNPKSILGSQMRTGKTIETLKLVKDLDLENVLVVCPKPTVPTWQFEAERWYGKEFADRFVVFNYEKLLNPEFFGSLLLNKWDLIVYDECHRLKNPKAKRTKAATTLSYHTDRLILASGTPIQNGPQDAFSLLHMIDPVAFPKYTPFINEYCVIQMLPRPPFPHIIVGAKNKEKLNIILHQHMLRRLLSDVQKDLPPILPVETIPVELDDEQLIKYMQMEDELFVMLDSGEQINAPNVLACRLRLRQICLEPNLLASNLEDKKSSPSAKTKLIVELLEDRGEDEGKTLVFTYFEKYAKILAEEIRKAGVSCALYTGQEKDLDKLAAYKAFQNEVHPRVLVGTIGSMGLSLTLTRADMVIVPDWFYNPAVNDQAIYRTQGTGQTRAVHVVDLWAKGTVEDAVHRVISSKRKMFNDIIEVDEATIKELRRIREERKR